LLCWNAWVLCAYYNAGHMFNLFQPTYLFPLQKNPMARTSKASALKRLCA
jgi:hypothetical protein